MTVDIADHVLRGRHFYDVGLLHEEGDDRIGQGFDFFFGEELALL